MEEDTMETETHSNRKGKKKWIFCEFSKNIIEKAKRKRGGDDGSDDESSNKKNFANNNKGGKPHKPQDSKPVNKHTGSDYKSKKGVRIFSEFSSINYFYLFFVNFAVFLFLLIRKEIFLNQEKLNHMLTFLLTLS